MIAVDPAKPRGLVWIASYPKSGNTWVRVFLHHLVRIIAGKPLEGNDLEELNRTSVNEASRLDLYAEALGKPVAASDWRDIARVRPLVQAEIMRRASGVMPVKTHNLMGQSLGQPTINRAVSAGAIYIVRNPLDVAPSLHAHLGPPTTLDETIAGMARRGFHTPNSKQQVSELWGAWSEHVESWTAEPSPVVHVVRYEDLVAEPIAGFAAIAEHMRIGAEPAEIAEAVGLSSFERLRKLEESGFNERPPHMSHFFREGRAGSGRASLSPEQAERIVAEHGETMRRFGYRPN